MFSGCLYQMLVDAMGVFLPDDPDGNAKLIFSILDCLPKANRVRSASFDLIQTFMGYHKICDPRLFPSLCRTAWCT